MIEEEKMSNIKFNSIKDIMPGDPLYYDKEGKLLEKSGRCNKCMMLMQLFKQTPGTDRDYWLMTELFVMLHGSDVCAEAGHY